MLYNVIMNTLTTVLIAFGAISLIMACAYLYIFERSKERFIRYWGLCWLCYSCSLLLLILGEGNNYEIYPVLRKMFDIANILFLLFGVYSFQNIRIPGYWSRFTLYLLIWSFLSIIYYFDLMSFYIPASAYQICMTAMICYLILHRWQVPQIEKITSTVVFAIWGLGKASISIIGLLYPDNIPSFYLAEVIFSNILNFTVVVIYLQRAESKLYHAESQFKLIAENASDIIFFYRIEPASFTYVTPSVENVLGYLPQDFYDETNFLIDIADQDDTLKILNLFDYKSLGNDNRNVVKLFRKNAQAIWAEISTTVVYENKVPIALEGVIRDISSTKAAEEQMIESKKSKEIFISYISHELKTPVTSLLAYISAIRSDTFDTEEKKDAAMEVIYKKTLTLERLINDLFQLSKLETRQFSFDFMVMDGNDLVQGLVRQHFFNVKNAGLNLVIKTDKNALNNVSLIVDEARIHQVFANILANAIRFSPKDGTIRVNFDVDSKNNLLVISVRDFGPGIAAKDIPHIFDRFYRVNKGEHSAREDTSGLGMTISKEIIEAHKGTITLKSRLQRGTTFVISLPLYNEYNE